MQPSKAQQVHSCTECRPQIAGAEEVSQRDDIVQISCRCFPISGIQRTDQLAGIDRCARKHAIENTADVPRISDVKCIKAGIENFKIVEERIQTQLAQHIEICGFDADEIRNLLM